MLTAINTKQRHQSNLKLTSKQLKKLTATNAVSL